MKQIKKVYKSTYCFLLLSLLVIAGCTNNSEMKDNDQKAAQALVGVWRGAGDYSDGKNEGWKQAWVMRRQQNGKFVAEYLFTHKENKQYGLITEMGTWDYENGHYLEVNSYDEKSIFEVSSLKKDSFEYNYLNSDSDVTIQETKTVESYQLQEPPKDYTKYTKQALVTPSAETIENITKVDE